MEKEKAKNKELIIAPPSDVPNLDLFLDQLKENDLLLIDPIKIKKKEKF